MHTPRTPSHSFPFRSLSLEVELSFSLFFLLAAFASVLMLGGAESHAGRGLAPHHAARHKALVLSCQQFFSPPLSVHVFDIDMDPKSRTVSFRPDPQNRSLDPIFRPDPRTRSSEPICTRKCNLRVEERKRRWINGGEAESVVCRRTGTLQKNRRERGGEP